MTTAQLAQLPHCLPAGLPTLLPSSMSTTLCWACSWISVSQAWGGTRHGQAADALQSPPSPDTGIVAQT